MTDEAFELLKKRISDKKYETVPINPAEKEKRFLYKELADYGCGVIQNSGVIQNNCAQERFDWEQSKVERIYNSELNLRNQQQREERMTKATEQICEHNEKTTNILGSQLTCNKIMIFLLFVQTLLAIINML